jgi:hypothetical protein
MLHSALDNKDKPSPSPWGALLGAPERIRPHKSRIVQFVLVFSSFLPDSGSRFIEAPRVRPQLRGEGGLTLGLN